MPQSDHDRIIALAGLYQATALVRDIARSGQFDQEDFATCVNSLFVIDAADSVTIYGGLDRLRSGLRLLDRQLRQSHDVDLSRYAVLLLVLERKLAGKPRLLAAVRDGIGDARRKLDYFPATHDNMIARLAELYTSTISTLKPRVMVNGHYENLSRPDNANRIRTLLLAGIRAAVLWRQSGGSRLTLLFGRKRLLQTAQHLLLQLDESPLPDNA